MTTKRYNELLAVAADMGDKFKVVIEQLGQEGFERFQRMIIARFSGDGVEQMDMGEWVLFAWRYYSELERRERSGAEADKLLQWAVAAWLVDRHQAQLNVLMLGQDERSKIRPVPPELDAFREALERLSTYGTDMYSNMTTWAVEQGYRKDEAEMTPRQAKNFASIILKYVEEVCTFISTLVRQAQTLSTSVENAFNGLAAMADGLDKEHVDYVKNLQTSLVQRQKALTTLENQLGLYSVVADSAAILHKKVMEKAERYRLAHPKEYEWVCPHCDWKGQLLKRQRVEDSLINVLDLWWLWKCPSCGEMIAYDKKHPLFDGKIVFSTKAWELVKAGNMTLADMAYILETSPEHIVYALRTIYHDDLPEHVQKEWEAYDNASKGDIVDEQDSEAVLSDPDVEDEEF